MMIKKHISVISSQGCKVSMEAMYYFGIRCIHGSCMLLAALHFRV